MWRRILCAFLKIKKKVLFCLALNPAVSHLLCTFLFPPLMWRKFAICCNMGLHFSTEHYKASPDPLLLRKSRWHNSLQPELVRAHRAHREGEAGRTACKRPAGPAALFPLCCCCLGGEFICFKTAGQEEVYRWRGSGDDDRTLGPAVRTRKGEGARWLFTFLNACAGPGARSKQQVEDMSWSFCHLTLWVKLHEEEFEKCLKCVWFVCFVWKRKRGECGERVFWQDSYGIWGAWRAPSWHSHQKR